MLRTSVRCLLLFALTAVPAQARAPSPEEKASGEALEYQKKLGERVPTYGVKIQTTLDRVLDDLLKNQGVQYTLNEEAFRSAGVDQPATLLKQTTIDPFETTNLRRRAILKQLMARIPCTMDKTAAIFVLRPDAVEITTREAYQKEFFPETFRRALAEEGDKEAVWVWSAVPPLSYASFEETPLSAALKELARDAEVSIVVDPRVAEEAKTKVTADLIGVPTEAAVRVLADMAGLKLVRLENVYYVTSEKNARVLQDEKDKRRLEKQKEVAPAAEPRPRNPE
jgi:hypothetical protein